MSEPLDSRLPESPKRRCRGWPRILFVGAMLAVIVVVSVGVLVLSHLDLLAKWNLERAFPGLVFEMGSLRVPGWDRLEVRELEVRSARSGEVLLRLEDGTVMFRFDDLLAGRIRELRLRRPELIVSPDIGEAVPAQSGRESRGDGSAGMAWSIGRLAVEDGALLVKRFGERVPEVSLQFSANLKDFGAGGAAADVRHRLNVEAVAVKWSSRPEQPILTLDRAGIAFTTGGLLSRKYLDRIEVESGTLTVDTESAAMFAGSEGAGSDPHGSAGEPDSEAWTVGEIAVKSIEARGRGLFVDGALVDGVLSAELRNIPLSLAGGEAFRDEQRMEVSGLRMTVPGDGEESSLKVDRAALRFSVADLSGRRIQEIELENPEARIGGLPNGGVMAPAASGTDGGPHEAAAWNVGRVVCDFGTLSWQGLGERVPNGSLRFAFDWREVATGGEGVETLHELVVWGAELSAAVDPGRPFLELDLVTARASVAGLLRDRKMESLDLNGGRLVVGEAFESLLAANAARPDAAGGGNAATAKAEAAWTLGRLDLRNIRTRLDDPRPEVADVFFTLNTNLTNLALSAAPEALLNEEQTIEFSNLEIRSPVDGTTKILTLRSVFVRFSLEQLAAQRVREIVVLRPTLYIGPDLFAYMDQMQRKEEAEGEDRAAEAGKGWVIDRLEVKFGSLVLGSGRERNVGLPLEFETVAENVAFDNLATLRWQGALRVPRQSYAFDSYQLELTDVSGDLRFAYPPEQNNVVQKLGIERINWRQYEAAEAWIAVTFDVSGINGQFGAEAYDGYVNGGFSFFFQQTSPWIGWVAGTTVDVQKVTSILSPQNFQMTGPVDFNVQMDAEQVDIGRVRGMFEMTEPGRLRITKLDDLLAAIPPEWNTLKQSSTRIALEALRDFEYTDAKGDFWFVQSQGILNLSLRGPGGSRNFEVVLHDGEGSEGRWQAGRKGAE